MLLLTTRFQTLLASGLPFGWMTVLVGWQEGDVSTEEMQVYAGDQLASCSEPDWYCVFRLYDADPTNTSEVNRLLQELTDGQEDAREAARLTWDLALLKPLLEDMKDEHGSINETCDALFAFTYFWAERGYPAYSPHTVQGRGNNLTPSDYFQADNYRRILEAHRQWVLREEALLRQKSSS